jgi:hypothetical protein
MMTMAMMPAPAMPDFFVRGKIGLRVTIGVSGNAAGDECFCRLLREPAQRYCAGGGENKNTLGHDFLLKPNQRFRIDLVPPAPLSRASDELFPRLRFMRCSRNRFRRRGQEAKFAA